jgi:hypothetical protein
MTFGQVAEIKLGYQKTKEVARTLFSHHGLHPRLQAIKLLASLTHPLKITNSKSIPHLDTSCNVLLVDIQHSVGLHGCCGCAWCLNLQHLNLLLK